MVIDRHTGTHLGQWRDSEPMGQTFFPPLLWMECLDNPPSLLYDIHFCKTFEACLHFIIIIAS